MTDPYELAELERSQSGPVPKHLRDAALYGVQGARLAALNAELVTALEKLIGRFHKCLVFSGTDPEYADEAVKADRALINKVKENT